MDSDNELSNVSFDDGQLMNFPYKLNKMTEKSIVKHPKSILKCVVCGDNALGKKNFLFFFLLLLFCFNLY